MMFFFPYKLKIFGILIITIIFIFLSFYGINSCSERQKEKRLIEHNTEKLDNEVEAAKQSAQALINKRKLELKKEAAKEIEKLTPEEREKRKREALIELESDLNL